ncbi:bile acid:sodium symporter family protein [Pseudactinotalea sp. Z1748]|uniref:bile acid:sodium symporter family protein n=1 Tax=Pseudactinotalea sp. Z1748 TaxID=3413027 RepID=UPI003C7CFAAD
MYEFFQTVGSWGVTVFVVTSMLNVGLTQKPSRLLAHLDNRAFLLRMVLVNFVVVPALMIAAVYLVDLEPVYAAGILLFSLAAGAPFVIKLTTVSQSDIALATTVLLMLMVGTVVILPLALPQVIEGITVDTWQIAQSLIVQMILPLAVGMALLQIAERLVAVIQPWVAALSNIALYVLIVAIIIGYLPSMSDPALWKAIGVGLAVLFLALFLGWTMGDGHGHLQEVGGLATAQRNTAAALIVAQQNFDDPRVLVVITLLNTLGVVMLIGAAKLMSRENSFAFLIPAAADVPGEDSIDETATARQ